MQNEYVSAVKTHASALVEHLNRYGIKLKKTQAIEVIANLQGQTDWNRVRAKLNGVEEMRTQELPVGTKPLRATMLLGRPGIGKTEALKTIFELEEADRQSTPLFICLSGSAHVYQNERDTILQNTNNFNVYYSSSGIEKTAGGIRLENAPIMINMVSSVRGSRHGLKHALISFLIQNKEIFQNARIGSVLIDELHCLQVDEEREIIETLAWFSATLSKPIRQLVMASQVMPSLKAVVPGVELKLLVDSRFPPTNKWTFDGKFAFPHERVGQVYQRDGLGAGVQTSEPGSSRKGQRDGNGSGVWADPRLPWKSQSIDDESLVKDIFNSVMMAMIYEMSCARPRANGTTRLQYVLGESLWFRDLRAELLRR